MRNERAITLISLVITIIVLIILASVAIYLNLGNNGIFTRAKQAREDTNKQEATEIINLKITTAQMDKYAKKQEMPTLQELADALYEDDEIEYVSLERKVADKEKITVGDNEAIYTKLNKYPYEFEINARLQLASINGVKIAATDNNNSSNVELKIIEQKSMTGVDGTVTFSVNKGTKYYLEVLFICSNQGNYGKGNNMIVNISNAELVTHINAIQHKGYANTYAGRYNATFNATDTDTMIYVRPTPGDPSNSGIFNFIVTLYSIS